MRRLTFAPLLLAALGGCLSTEPTDPGDDDTALVADDEGKADGQLRAHVTGMTVWLDPQVTREQRDGTTVLTMRGTSSVALDEVFGFVPDDPFGEATLLSPTRFEVMLNEGHEANTMLSGLPLFVRLHPQAGGDGATAALWLRPRFTGFSGSSSVWVDAALAPVWVGGQVIYRARAGTSSGYDALWVTGPAAALPKVTAEGTRRWTLDFTYDQLA
ncbi:MAG TPA: hypothetical protein VL172_02495, partial [Kofleriaceae bacterium]|nr:hypothetical protein [Kofleriaceae bacterium]